MKRIFAMLLVLMILFSGCVSDNKKENDAVTDAPVPVSEQESVDSGAEIATSAPEDIDSGAEIATSAPADVDSGEAED